MMEKSIKKLLHWNLSILGLLMSPTANFERELKKTK